jgi:nitrate/TMAO reductase-like tetraheme cytochrome c subunit
MSDADDESPKKRSGWRGFTLFGVPIVGGGLLFAAGIIFWGGFNTAMEATNTMPFCISCHEMHDNVYLEYRETIHYRNATGVGASCSDCHVPDPWIHKVVRKVEATRELYHKAMGTINTPEKFEEHRLRMATNVWQSMKRTDSRECRNCHDFVSMLPEFQAPRARRQHLNALQNGNTCIDCHKGIAHRSVRDQLSDEELEALEAPLEAHIRPVPVAFMESLTRIEAIEAAAAEQAAAEARAAEAAMATRIAAAVEAARVEEQTRLAALFAATAEAAEDAHAAEAPAAVASGEVAPGIDWSAVPPRQVTLFYPGQASFEWVQNGRDHGGARPFTRAGDRCATCHAAELPTIGLNIVRGGELEPTPIPDKRPVIDVTLQAAHDDKSLYLRLSWPNVPHTPAPFVEGGKMDPDNPVKVAMMIAGSGIEYVEQAGCWATCHHDNRYMPDAPDMAAFGDFPAGRLHLDQGVTKYLAESRTEIEIAGRGGASRGGWANLRGEDEIAALLEAGTFMDLLRAAPGGSADNGHLLEQRVEDGGPMAASVTLDGDTWTAVLSRPLQPEGPGNIALEPGRTYTVGLAIHDDYTDARFHHVSLELTMGLDDPAAEINVVKP